MILLDYRDKRPIYEQVVEKLEHLIVGGALGANEKMPSVRSLGMELTVNPNTIQRAYNQLEQDGYLYTIAGRGSFVAPETEWRTGRMKKVLEEWCQVPEKNCRQNWSRFMTDVAEVEECRKAWKWREHDRS